MSCEIYIFGSATRGEVAKSSDLDVLVVPDTEESRGFPSDWSVYSREVLQQQYSTGRLFAWHLHLEAIRIYPKQGLGFLAQIGPPSPYLTAAEDIAELKGLLSEALDELDRGSPSTIYELGIVYTAIRDIAMSASWSLLGSPSFSRYAPYQLPDPCPLPLSLYEVAMSARHASTRGAAEPATVADVALQITNFPVLDWASNLWRKLV